jgi:hypothetical protein
MKTTKRRDGMAAGGWGTVGYRVWVLIAWCLHQSVRLRHLVTGELALSRELT